MKDESLNYKPFEAKDIFRILGFNKNRLWYLVHAYHLLEPEIEASSGTGKSNKFSRNNLLELMLIKELSRCGLGLNAIKSIKKSFEKESRLLVEEAKKSKADIRNIYDRAFLEPPIGLRIARSFDWFEVSVAEWRPAPLSNKDDEEVLKYNSYIMINISTLAGHLKERLSKV